MESIVDNFADLRGCDLTAARRPARCEIRVCLGVDNAGAKNGLKIQGFSCVGGRFFTLG
jgi:hypothetical protein